MTTSIEFQLLDFMRHSISHNRFQKIGRNMTNMIEINILEWNGAIAKREKLSHKFVEIYQSTKLIA